ncbi:MRC1 protein, partial [Columbina picui]|nr:MRC1 protein [Columbina picui]
ELTKKFGFVFWIGLNTLNFNSGWKWAGGNPLRYLNWAPGKNCSYFVKFEWILARHQLIKNCPSYLPIKCTNGWWPYAGHYCIIQREPKLWKGALTSCKKQDGDLASVHNIAEHSFLVSQLGYREYICLPPREELWLGLNDLRGHFYCKQSDGTPVTFTKWQCRHPTYTNGLEDCIDGYWATDVCDKQRGYICKKEPSSQASERGNHRPKLPASKCSLINRSLIIIFSSYGGKQVGKYPWLWMKTVFYFRNKQGFLVSLMGLRCEKYFWIGLSNTEEHESFRWTSGETPLFTHWNTAMPSK